MIEINVKRNPKGIIELIEASGHAGSGPLGHDLVCAGVSAIIVGGANAIRNPSQFDIDIRKGYAKIEKKKRGVITKQDVYVIETIFIQLRTIESSYNKNIKIKILKKGKKTK